MQQASYLEGGPLVWLLPLYWHVNQNSDDDDDDEDCCCLQKIMEKGEVVEMGGVLREKNVWLGLHCLSHLQHYFRHINI